MVIKRRYKAVKSLQNAAGFLLLEAVSLLGFVVVSVSLLASLHGRLMSFCQETTNCLRALMYAENVLASTLTGVPYGMPQDFFRAHVRQQATSYQAGIPALSVTTVTVAWHEPGGDKKIVLTRCEPSGTVHL